MSVSHHPSLKHGEKRSRPVYIRPGLFLIVRLMKHFHFPQQFRALFEESVDRYGRGEPLETFFRADEKAWLAANGMTPQHLFDYAEDFHTYDREPGLEHALAIEMVRRDYFLNVQGGRSSTTQIDGSKLPAKSDTVRGIGWLPRLLPKASAKLRGELPSSLMFCCGGDRAFFKEHDIVPAEFLALVWRNNFNDAAIVDWVVQRSAAR